MKKIIIVENCMDCPYHYYTEDNDIFCWNTDNNIKSEDHIIKNVWLIPEWCTLKMFEG